MNLVFEQFLEALREEEFFCEEEQEWQFRDGSACGICTSSAMVVARHFGGVVFGYHSIDNPTAFIGEPDYNGHDFALVNSLWLVDYWAWHVAGLVTTPIFDLTNGNDRSIVGRLFGPRSNWSEVEINSTEDGRGLDQAGEHTRDLDLSDHDAPRRRW